MQRSLEEAYATACQKIGEGAVRESILIDELNTSAAKIATLEKQIEELQAQLVVDEAEGAIKEKAPEGKTGESSQKDTSVVRSEANGKADGRNDSGNR